MASKVHRINATKAFEIDENEDLPPAETDPSVLVNTPTTAVGKIIYT